MKTVVLVIKFHCRLSGSTLLWNWTVYSIKYVARSMFSLIGGYCRQRVTCDFLLFCSITIMSKKTPAPVWRRSPLLLKQLKIFSSALLGWWPQCLPLYAVSTQSNPQPLWAPKEQKEKNQIRWKKGTVKTSSAATTVCAASLTWQRTGWNISWLCRNIFRKNGPQLRPARAWAQRTSWN